MTNHLQFFKRTLGITLCLFLLPALIVVIFDPFFVLHKPFIHKDIGFDGTDRYQNAGLINSYLADQNDHRDTVILGTSMSQNLPVHGLENAHGVPALKLTLAGGRPKELAMIAEKALKTANVKHVVWEVFHAYANPDAHMMHPDSPLPEFLYNASWLDNWKYMFNNDVVEEALKVAIGKKKKRRPLDELYTWDKEKQFPAFVSEANIEKLKTELAKADRPLSSQPPTLYDNFPNVSQNLIPLLKRYPDVEFWLFFPPVSYFSYARQGNEQFWKEMQMRRFVIQQTQAMNHVHIYGFDLKNEWGGDLTNYMDKIHHKPEISAELLNLMQQNKNRLTLDTFDAYSNQLIKNVNAFKL